MRPRFFVGGVRTSNASRTKPKAHFVILLTSIVFSANIICKIKGSSEAPVSGVLETVRTMPRGIRIK